MCRRFVRLTLPLLIVWVTPGTGYASPPAYLEAPASDKYDVLPSGFTVEFWIKVNSKPGFDPRIVHCVNADPGPCAYKGNAQWSVFICNLSDCSPGTVLFEVGAGGACHHIASTGRVDDGAYHHIAGTYDGNVLRLYLDGDLQAELPLTGFRARVGGGRIVIGNTQNYTNAFDGEVDEFRIWNTARSGDEIIAFMHTEIEEEHHRLMGYWKFNGDGSDRIGGNTLVPHNYVLFPRGRLGRAADIVNADPVKG